MKDAFSRTVNRSCHSLTHLDAPSSCQRETFQEGTKEINIFDILQPREDCKVMGGLCPQQTWWRCLHTGDHSRGLITPHSLILFIFLVFKLCSLFNPTVSLVFLGIESILCQKETAAQTSFGCVHVDHLWQYLTTQWTCCVLICEWELSVISCSACAFHL